MANTKMSALAAAAALDGTELTHLVQSSANVQSTALAVAQSGIQLLGAHDLSVDTLDSGNEIIIDTNGAKIILVDLREPTFAVADGVNMQVSDNTGSTYFSASNDYEEYNFRNGGAAANINRSEFRITLADTASGTGFFIFSGFNDASVNPSGFGMFATSTTPYSVRSYLTDPSVGIVNYIKFFSNGGNAATGGHLTVYGL